MTTPTTAEEHDFDGHGGCFESCRQCRLTAALYALRHAYETADGRIRAPFLLKRNLLGGPAWMDAHAIAEVLER